MSQGDIEAIAVPVPGLEEQRVIATRVDTLLDGVRRLELLLEGPRTQAESFERALLAKAFRGELVSQDPNDEPAEVMLARLRAGDASTPEPTKRRRQSAAGAR